MAVKKTSGTTLPTFKFRSGGGIELISAAVKNKDGVILNKFLVKEHNPGKEGELREVAYYDTVIESSEIQSISYSTNGGVVFTLRDGQKISLDSTINKVDIKTPDSTKDGEVVLYGSTDGKTLKNSGLTISEDFREIDTNDSCLPTSKAVREYIEDAASVLNDRVVGNNVSNVPVDK